MSTYKHNCTKGPARFHLGRGANPRFHIQTEAGYQIASTTELSQHAQAKEENAMREANAELIAEAFSVLHETGMTPRELARRFNHFPALVEALEGLLKATRKAHDIAAQSNDVYADDEALFVGEWMDEAREVLKAAKG